jgi:hypothetical protein
LEQPQQHEQLHLQQQPQQQQQQHQQQQPLPAPSALGAYTQREEHLQRQEALGEIEFAYVLNDGTPINMKRCGFSCSNCTLAYGMLCTDRVVPGWRGTLSSAGCITACTVFQGWACA